MPRSESLILYHSKINQDSLGEMADSRAGAGRIQDELKCTVVTESKEVLKEQMRACPRGTGANLKEFSAAKGGTI